MSGRVSAHGGHSGQFCGHARDLLEEVVRAYAAQNYDWVGITEHVPPANERVIPAEEKSAGLTAAALYRRFASYVAACRDLQHRYRGSLRILVGFEAEACTGYADLTDRLLRDFAPDYFVGSVHHVEDIPIDVSADLYASAAGLCGGLDQLYCRYFDLQF